MTKITDKQKGRVYSWEDDCIKPHDTTRVAFDNAQSIVDWIWDKEGLKYPPKIVLKDPRHTTALATGARMKIEIEPEVPTWVIIHELSHSMTSTFDGDSVGHNKTFVGVYMKLAEKYLKLNLLVLMARAKHFGVEFDITASPIFLD